MVFRGVAVFRCKFRSVVVRGVVMLRGVMVFRGVLWCSGVLVLVYAVCLWRVVKGIFVTRDLPFFAKWLIFFLMNRDFRSSREA